MDRLRTWSLSPWVQIAATFALALALAVVAHRLWRADLAYPFAYWGDGFQYLMYGKSIHDHGWMLENGLLGAPFGLYMYDWAEGGWLSLIGLRVLDLALGDWVVAYNLFYLLGYPFAALAGLWALKRLAVATPLAIALAALYAIVPYHLDRGQNHYMLSLYYGLPPLLSYAITTAAGRAPIPGLPRGPVHGGWRNWVRRAGPALLAAALAGLMVAYYVVFAAVIMAAAAAFGWLRSRRFAVGASGLLMCGVLGVAMLAQYSPVLAYRLAHGTNHDVGQRYLGEVENYPLKPMDLILPAPGHPLRPLAELRTRYSQFGSPGQSGVALGTVGAVGMILALGAFVASAAASGRHRRLSLARRRLSPVGWLIATGLGTAVLGGGATLFGFVVGPYVRAWDRMAILVAFLALAALGLVLTALLLRIRRSRRPIAGLMLAGLLVVVGTADQATGPFVPPYAAIRQEWRTDAHFVGELEAQLPKGSMVYQLPYITFPETRLQSAGANDMLRMYLHSTSLRWSGGYLRGREPGWQIVQQSSSTAQLIALLHALGYAGLTADRRGYTDPQTGESNFEAFVAALRAELGPEDARSADDRVVFFRLDDGGIPTARAARDALDPVWMRWASGFDLMYMRDGQITHRARSAASIELRNERSEAREVVVAFDLAPHDARRLEVEVTWPDGARDSITLAGSSVGHRRQLVLPPGRSSITLVIAGEPPRAFQYTLADLAVVDTSLAHLLPEWAGQ